MQSWTQHKLCLTLSVDLLSQAGSTSLFNERHLLFSRHAMDVPQMLSATLQSVSRKVSLGCEGRG